MAVPVVDRVLEVRVGGQRGHRGEHGLRVRRDRDGDARLVGLADRGHRVGARRLALVLVEDVHHGAVRRPDALGVRLGGERRLLLDLVGLRLVELLLPAVLAGCPLRRDVGDRVSTRKTPPSVGVVEHHRAVVDAEDQLPGCAEVSSSENCCALLAGGRRRRAAAADVAARRAVGPGGVDAAGDLDRRGHRARVPGAERGELAGSQVDAVQRLRRWRRPRRRSRPTAAAARTPSRCPRRAAARCARCPAGRSSSSSGRPPPGRCRPW